MNVPRPTSTTYRLILIVTCLLVILAGCQPGTQQPVTPALITFTASPAPTATITPSPTSARFNGERAYEDVKHQVELGPRTPGSPAHAQVVEWIQAELTQAGWQVELQETTYAGQPVRNIIAKHIPAGSDSRPWIIVGAHYDSRLWATADPDPANQRTPVPAANDGASGAAVLLELARVLPGDLDKQVWLVFFDSEDQGEIPGWDWILGSQAFVESLTDHPDAMVLVDMIGDADLNLYYERNSNPELSQKIWELADQLGYAKQFIPTPKYSMLDDHTPFLEAGIPAVDLIDFDYPYWHTLADTPDKVSAESLMAVGDTLETWLEK